MELNKNIVNGLHDLICIISEQELTLQDKLQRVHELLLQQINAQKGSLIILDKGKNVYQVVASTNKDLLGAQKNVKAKTIIGQICEKKKPILIKNMLEDKRFQYQHRLQHYKSLLACPLHNQEYELIGIFNAFNFQGRKNFDEEDLEIISQLLFIFVPLLENLHVHVENSFGHPPKDVLSEILSGNEDLYQSDAENILELGEEPAKESQSGLEEEFISLEEVSIEEHFEEGGKKPKKKTTHYLEPELSERMDLIKDQLKKIAHSGQKSQISKSSIVNLALEILFSDYNKKKDKSLLMKAFKPDDSN